MFDCLNAKRKILIASFEILQHKKILSKGMLEFFLDTELSSVMDSFEMFRKEARFIWTSCGSAWHLRKLRRNSDTSENEHKNVGGTNEAH